MKTNLIGASVQLNFSKVIGVIRAASVQKGNFVFLVADNDGVLYRVSHNDFTLLGK